MPAKAVCPHCGAAVPSLATAGDRCQFCGRELRVGPGGDIAFLRIQQQLQRLERRIGTIEERLGISEPAAERPRGEALVPPPIRAAAAGPASAPEPALPELAPVAEAPLQPATAGPPEPILLRQGPAGPADLPGPSLQGPVPAGWEQTIGLKWAAWVGAVVLVIGAGLGIKFAYDQGWLGNLSPTTRLLLLSLVGFGLLLAGEVVYRRVNVISAAGLFGAGVGVLFLVSYAGNVYYQVYSYEVAFVFVAFTTVIGSAVAMRAQMVSVAVLAQIGGNAAPFVLSTGEPPGLAFFTYLLMLQVVALSLALWGNSPKWWILRGQSLATTAFWVFMALRTEEALRGLHDESFWFSLLYAIAFQRELIWSAVRIRQAEDAAEVVPPRELLAGWGVMFSMLVTAGVTGAILFILKDYPDLVRGGWVLGLAAICAALGFTLLFRIDQGVADVWVVLNWQQAAAGAIVAAMILLRRKSTSPERALDFLAVLIGLWVGTLEIDRLFTHTLGDLGDVLPDPQLAKLVAISIFWSLYAVGLVVLGFRFRFAGLRYFGLGLFALTLAKVALFDLSRVEQGYRILSTLGLGVLLLGTSVLYGKLSPRLLARGERRPADRRTD